ncbi:hypothetical protein [Mesorhizobium sp. Mes31]|uniref:hypothetical protein n=1 Tax=Mesorhizobium sp. Mes31 TaxID=2926017 RepID=UPI00211784BD|nr:hypothetical protein [Mesorhizobium sp. Mes31]
MTPIDHEISSAAIAKQRVENAISCLQLTEQNRFAPEYLASVALNEIFMAAAGANLPAVAPEASLTASKMLRDCCPVVDASVGRELSSERLYLLMGTAAGLLTLSDDPFRADRLAYTGILAAQLGVIHHQRCLNERGNPLLRDARMRHAWAAPRDPDGLEQ